MVGINIGVGLKSRASSTPLNTFAPSDVGDILDFSDGSRRWQDTAATTPAAADSDPIGRIDGLRGVLSMRQTSGTARPTYKTSAGKHWAEFTAASFQRMFSASAFNLSTVDKLTVLLGIQKSSDAAAARLIETSADAGANDGAFVITAPDANGLANYGIYARGTAVGGFRATTYTAPVANVVGFTCDLSQTALADELKPIIDGVTPTLTVQAAGPSGTGNFGNHVLNLGSQNNASRYFSGRVYYVYIIGRVLSAGELASVSTYIRAKMP